MPQPDRLMVQVGKLMRLGRLSAPSRGQSCSQTKTLQRISQCTHTVLCMTNSACTFLKLCVKALPDSVAAVSIAISLPQTSGSECDKHVKPSL